MTQPVGPYRPLVAVGGWIALSGQLGVQQGELVNGGVVAETRQALDNITDLLAGVGATPSQVVKATVFLRHMRDYPLINEVWRDHFGDSPPARSVVAVAELPLHALVEIDAWAWVGGD
jgi:2-iminobutanoate/2-iminopropanoate deaminase